MGKFSRSWELVKQSFAILRSDKQLMLFPVFSAIACLIVTAIIATGGAVLMLPAMPAAAAADERFNPNQSPVFLLGTEEQLPIAVAGRKVRPLQIESNFEEILVGIAEVDGLRHAV